MDPRWLIKKDEWSQDTAYALRFFEELRLLFTVDELTRHFPIILEYYLRNDIQKKVDTSALRTAQADYHIETIVNYLETFTEGVFILESHLTPDMELDRTILLRAFERATGAQ